MFYISGDIHGCVEEVISFCERNKLSSDDTIILLGDVGLNYFGNENGDKDRKEALNMCGAKILCIHGNHEMRPESLDSYSEKEWNGGIVYYEEEFPNILFAKDGEVYDLNGKKAIAIGGAYSIDKAWRVEGQSWWADEQPSPEIKARVEQALEQLNWQIDIVLTHTTPLKYEPIEVFLPGIDQSKVDKRTEAWLDSIETRLEYGRWYCGHYHTEKKIDRLQIMFNDYAALEADCPC